jgi:hypothetical protein
MATRGSLEVGNLIDQLVGPERAYDKAVYRGRVYSDKAPLGGLIGSIPCKVGEALFPVEHWRFFLTSLCIAALPAALTGWMMFMLALRYNDDWRIATFISFATMWGTNLLYWSTLMFSHSLTAALLVGAFYLLKRQDDPTDRDIATAGLCAGLAVASDYYVILLLPLFFFWCWPAFKRRTFWLVCGAAIAGVLPAAYHYAIFGNPLTLPYSHHATTAAHHATGFMGIIGPSPKGIWVILCSRAYGLFVYNPILIATALAAPLFFRRHRRDACFFLAVCVVLTLFNASINDVTYGFGWSWGPRYIMPMVPFAMLTLTVVWAEGAGDHLRRATRALAALSIALNIYIANIMYPPPSLQAFSFLFKDGVDVMREYGGLSAFSVWMKINGRANPALSIAATLLLFTILAVLWKRCLCDAESPSATQAVEADPPGPA